MVNLSLGRCSCGDGEYTEACSIRVVGEGDGSLGDGPHFANRGLAVGVGVVASTNVADGFSHPRVFFLGRREGRGETGEKRGDSSQPVGFI